MNFKLYAINLMQNLYNYFKLKA